MGRAPGLYNRSVTKGPDIINSDITSIISMSATKLGYFPKFLARLRVNAYNARIELDIPMVNFPKLMHKHLSKLYSLNEVNDEITLTYDMYILFKWEKWSLQDCLPITWIQFLYRKVHSFYKLFYEFKRNICATTPYRFIYITYKIVRRYSYNYSDPKKSDAYRSWSIWVLRFLPRLK